MINIVRSPDPNLDLKNIFTSIFLAGSIEDGKAHPWHDDFVDLVISKVMLKIPNLDKDRLSRITFFNPRRIEWNQEIAKSDLTDQINWELERILNSVNTVFFYFQAGTISPISLLELGLCLSSPGVVDVVVVCEPGYFRVTNVAVTAELFGVKTFSTLEDGAEKLSEILVKNLSIYKNNWKETE